MAVFYGTPNVMPVYLRIQITANHVFHLINFDPFHMLNHNIIALIEVIFYLDIPTWIKFTWLHLDIKHPLVILLSINVPWPPNILNHLCVFNWVLKDWVLWVKILMVHSNYNVFTEGSPCIWIIYHYLVISWRQECWINEVVSVFNALVKIWWVHCVHIRKLIIVALVI